MSILVSHNTCCPIFNNLALFKTILFLLNFENLVMLHYFRNLTSENPHCILQFYVTFLCKWDHVTCLNVWFVIHKSSVTLQTGTSTIHFLHTNMAFRLSTLSLSPTYGYHITCHTSCLSRNIRQRGPYDTFMVFCHKTTLTFFSLTQMTC
jgi:hypothetical protein